VAAAWAKVCVFISSTFNDMHAERDYLVKRVLPDLEEWCERRRLRLVAVDLRWGITEEEATRNKNVVKVCLSHVDECRPFFLCFVGQRYGWVPAANDVSPETLTRYPHLRQLLGRASVTEMEVVHATRDPEGSAGAFFYLRSPSYLETLPASPPQLRDVYVDLPGQVGRRTALEVLTESTIPATRRPVRRYQASWRDGPGHTTPELALPLACPSVLEENLLRWREQWRHWAGLDVTGTALGEGSPQAEAASRFNASLTRGRLADFVCPNQAGHPVPLNQVILQDLQGALTQLFPGHTEAIDADDLQRELDQHEAFLFDQTSSFVSRPGETDSLDAYLADVGECRPFLLTGASGMGKSALLANWVEHHRRNQLHRGTTWHVRFAGVSDRSATIEELLGLLLRELKERFGKLDADVPDNPERLLQALPDLFAQLGRHGRTVLVIDGLDQLETGPRVLDWLPCPLPEGVKLVLSHRRGDPEAERLLDRLPSEAVLSHEVRPFEGHDERRQLVDVYLRQYLKQLDDPVLEQLVALDGARNPLFLKVVLAELRVFGSFANLRDKVVADFGGDPLSAFEGLLRRLENDPAYTALNPTTTVPLLFGLLAHARRGLSRDELADLLLRHYAAPAAEAPSREQARDAVSLYLRQARLFLARRDGRFDFYYESFRAAAVRRYGSEGPASWHRRLADYFRDQPHYCPPAPGRSRPLVPNSRKAQELPWQQTRAADWAGLERTLCDLEFVEAKCRAGMAHDLIGDHAAATAACPALPEAVRLYDCFVSEHAHIFARDPTLVLPFAHNYASDGPVVEEADRRLAVAGWRRSPWIELLDRPPQQRRPALVRSLEGHHGAVRSVALSADGRVAVSGGDEGTARVWDVGSGVGRRTIVCGPRAVHGVALTPDGVVAATASGDGLVRVWDLVSGACRATLAGHRGPVRAVALSADGNQLVSAGHDGTVRLWRVGRPQAVRVLTGHFGPVTAVTLAGDGRLAASGSRDGMVRVWETGAGRMVRCLKGVPLAIQGVAASADFTLVATCCGIPPGPGGKVASQARQSSAVRFWRRDHCVFEGWEHELVARGGLMGVVASAVFGIALSGDGGLAVSVGYDGNLIVWDVARGRMLRKLTAHASPILAVALDGAAARCVTASEDRTLRVWRLDGDWPPPEFTERLHRIPLRIQFEPATAPQRPEELDLLVRIVRLFNRSGSAGEDAEQGSVPWPRLPAEPRLGRVGRGGRASLGEKARLIWKNRKARTWAVVPGWFLLLAGLVYQVGGGGFAAATLAASLFVFGVAGFVHWQWWLGMRTDLHEWKTDPLPESLQSLLGLPFCVLFRVVHCPRCGRRLCGRRRLFCCGQCGWRD
jgi:WD40 repeat protein